MQFWILFHPQIPNLQSDEHLKSHGKKYQLFSDISKRPDECWSDDILENGKWESIQNLPISVGIIFHYKSILYTQLEPMF